MKRLHAHLARPNGKVFIQSPLGNLFHRQGRVALSKALSTALQALPEQPHQDLVRASGRQSLAFFIGRDDPDGPIGPKYRLRQFGDVHLQDQPGVFLLDEKPLA